MLFYAVIFLALGAALGVFIKNQQNALVSIVGISVIWGLVWGPWAIATFIELLVGYALVGGFSKTQE